MNRGSTTSAISPFMVRKALQSKHHSQHSTMAQSLNGRQVKTFIHFSLIASLTNNRRSMAHTFCCLSSYGVAS